MRRLGMIGRWLLCGIGMGLVLAIGGRLAMRAVALLTHQTPGFSIEATLGITLIALIIGIIATTLFLPVRALVPGSGLWKGGLFGLLAMLLLVPVLPAPIKEEIAEAPAVVGHVWLLFGAVFVLAGITAQILTERLLPRAQQPAKEAPQKAGA